jgi:signal transduction histidine kinase
MTTETLRLRVLIEALNHELRGPLAPLAIGIEILKRRGDGDEGVAKTLAMMERQILILKQALDVYLDESRIVENPDSRHRSPPGA